MTSPCTSFVQLLDHGHAWCGFQRVQVSAQESYTLKEPLPRAIFDIDQANLRIHLPNQQEVAEAIEWFNQTKSPSTTVFGISAQRMVSVGKTQWRQLSTWLWESVLKLLQCEVAWLIHRAGFTGD